MRLGPWQGSRLSIATIVSCYISGSLDLRSWLNMTIARYWDCSTARLIQDLACAQDSYSLYSGLSSVPTLSCAAAVSRSCWLSPACFEEIESRQLFAQPSSFLEFLRRRWRLPGFYYIFTSGDPWESMYLCSHCSSLSPDFVSHFCQWLAACATCGPSIADPTLQSWC